MEYDAASQWYNTSLTIVAEWIKSGGTVSYNALAQSPSSIRSKLLRLGLDVEQLEKLDWEGLRILDGHAAAHGKKSTERLTFDSLKVADLSISTSQEMKRSKRARVKLSILSESGPCGTSALTRDGID